MLFTMPNNLRPPRGFVWLGTITRIDRGESKAAAQPRLAGFTTGNRELDRTEERDGSERGDQPLNSPTGSRAGSASGGR